MERSWAACRGWIQVIMSELRHLQPRLQLFPYWMEIKTSELFLLHDFPAAADNLSLSLSLSLPPSISFNGIIVKPQHYGELTADQFQQRLAGEEKAREYAHHQKFKYCALDFSASLEAWRSDGKRGVWVKIPLTQAELVPIAAKVSPKKKAFIWCSIMSCFVEYYSLCFSFKLGFKFHHAHSDYVMMTQWLPVNEESTLPLYATHNIGTVKMILQCNVSINLITSHCTKLLL